MMCNSLFTKEASQTMIYICSRYRPLAVESADREAEKERNIERAKSAAFFVSELGFEAMCPHLYTNQFLDDDIVWQRELGMQIGLDWLELSGEMWIFSYDGLSSLSEGMRREVDFAVEQEIPIRVFQEDYLLQLADRLEGVSVRNQKEAYLRFLEDALHDGMKLVEMWKEVKEKNGK